jgi:hypothetical protein
VPANDKGHNKVKQDGKNCKDKSPGIKKKYRLAYEALRLYSEEHNSL